jgi:hypothetical protein
MFMDKMYRFKAFIGSEISTTNLPVVVICPGVTERALAKQNNQWFWSIV